MALGVIVGSSFLDSFDVGRVEERVVSTPYGEVTAFTTQWQGRELVFIKRHQFDPKREYTPPHAINHHALISAFKALSCSTVVGLQHTFCVSDA